jgi:hypothetical protein
MKQKDARMHQQDSQIADLKADLSAQTKASDAQIAHLKAQLTLQKKAVAEMKSLAEVFSARMAVLEHQRGITAQTASLRTQSGNPSGARTGATE